MKIAIDVTPLSDTRVLSHKVRGTGFYIENLTQSLKKYFPQHTYSLFNLKDGITPDCDVVHIPYFEPFFNTLPSNNKSRTIVTVHDLTPLVFPKHFPSGIRGKLRWFRQRRILRSVDRVITDSNASKNDICKFTNIDPEKISVVYLAAAEIYKKQEISSAYRTKLQKKYQLPEKFALYVGDATWNKNLPRLIKAIQMSNIPLVMVGKTLVEKEFDHNNPWNADLVIVQKYAENDKHIIRLGFIETEELLTLYNLATVFVMPSLYEGFGLPILEAMQSGVAVVTSKEGSLAEVAGEAAYYVDAYSIESISQGISTVFSNEKLRKELSEKGLEQAKRFTWKETAVKMVKIYEGKNDK